MRLKQVTLMIVLLTAILISSMACSVNKATTNPNKQGTMSSPSKQTTTASTGSIQEPTPNDEAFTFYNKVSLGMTKDQIDSILGVTPEEGTSYGVETYYQDKKRELGVVIYFNNRNQAYTKGVSYSSTKTFSPYCTKPVTKDQRENIKKGMSYKEVTAYLGGKGVEISQVATFDNPKAAPDTCRIWANNDNISSHIEVTFDSNGKVKDSLYDYKITNSTN